jgi:hypothetical protein
MDWNFEIGKRAKIGAKPHRPAETNFDPDSNPKHQIQRSHVNPSQRIN